jgi:hypothetical protein
VRILDGLRHRLRHLTTVFSSISLCPLSLPACLPACLIEAGPAGEPASHADIEKGCLSRYSVTYLHSPFFILFLTRPITIASVYHVRACLPVNPHPFSLTVSWLALTSHCLISINPTAAAVLSYCPIIIMTILLLCSSAAGCMMSLQPFHFVFRYR